MQAIESRPRPGFPHEIVWSGLATLTLLAARFFPFDRVPLGFCPLRTFTGVPCPSCGGTRSFVALAHLELGEAIRMNPLAALVGIGAMLYVAYSFGVWALGWKRWRPEAHSEARVRLLRYGVLGAVTLNWIYLIAIGR